MYVYMYLSIFIVNLRTGKALLKMVIECYGIKVRITFLVQRRKFHMEFISYKFLSYPLKKI